MVSTIMHLIWSATVAKLINLKNTLQFLFLGIFLDFDFILDLAYPRPIDHRDYFHNIFFIAAVLIVIWLWKRRGHDNKNKSVLLKSAAITFSLHIILDLFDGAGVPLLFPLSSERLLIYPIGQAYVFPLKFFWEGNIYFTITSLAIMLLTYRKSQR